jgi:tight adherence protein B
MGGLIGLMFGAGLVLVIFDTRVGDSSVRIRRARSLDFSTIPWPQFIDDVASGVRAGVAVPLAIFQAGERLPHGPNHIFEQWHEQWASGIGFEQTLRGLRETLNSAPFDQFAETMEIAHRQGGRTVATLLSQLARNVRAQEQLIHEVRGRQAVTVTSAKVAVGAPWVVLLLTCARPEVRSSYMNPLGVSVLLCVAAVCMVSYFAMRRLAEISELRVMR